MDRNLVVKDKIILTEAAICNIDGEVEIYQSSGNKHHYDFQVELFGNDTWSGSTSIRKPKNHFDRHPSIKFKDPIKIKSLRLDTWIKQHPEIIHIDLIWADVNGGERELIQGAKETLNITDYFYTEYSNNELYEGQPTKNELEFLLPDFKDIIDFSYGNVLFANKKMITK